MKKQIINLAILIFTTSFLNAQTTVGLIQHDLGSTDSGYVLFAPMKSKNTYLIDKCGKQVKTWTSNNTPALSCYLLPDGSLLRTGNINNPNFNTAGTGGLIEKKDWNGNITWSYIFSDSINCQHHDIKPLPNGNVLLIVWELKTNTQAIEQGRNPSLISSVVWSEKISEIQPVGLNGGNIVWEWKLWDHLIQDFDSTKSNYGSVSTNPQLLNINYNAGVAKTDWIHLNSVDYNPELDQIILSAHNFNEVWIIDHSTTTIQAASHLGGKSGNGGDLIYRWGNPQTYKNGTAADQKLFGQHNARWLEKGLPYENQIMIFNNGLNRTGGDYSTVEIINPPVIGYNYVSTLPYLPSTTSWKYNDGNTKNLSAGNISGAQPLPNGNVLITNGPVGTFIEIDSTGKTVWKYSSPVSNTGIIAQGANAIQNIVFKSIFYPNNYSGFAGRTLIPGKTIETINLVSDSCNMKTNNIDIETLYSISIFPNPACDFINIQNISNSDKNINIELYDLIGALIQKHALKVGTTNTVLDSKNLNSGNYLLKISSDQHLMVKKITIVK